MDLNLDFLNNATSHFDDVSFTNMLEFTNGSKFSIEFLIDIKAIIGYDKFIKILKIVDNSELTINILLNDDKISLVL